MCACLVAPFYIQVCVVAFAILAYILNGRRGRIVGLPRMWDRLLRAQIFSKFSVWLWGADCGKKRSSLWFSAFTSHVIFVEDAEGWGRPSASKT